MIDWDWANSGRQLAQLFVAFVLTLPVAWNRERADRVMGLRTFPLVAVLLGLADYLILRYLAKLKQE